METFIHFCEDELARSLPRLLGLMDRRPYSPTYGCFDKNYWHFRTKDFPSAITAQSLEVLAYQYSHSPNEQLMKWIQAGISFAATVQKSDGTFDEWYVGEHGWAGPTGYLIHSLCKAHQYMEEVLPVEDKTKLQDIIKKGAYSLTKDWEENILANHVAMAMLPLVEASNISSDDFFKSHYESLLSKLESLFNPGGWSLEYDGADIGYQSATLSFLSRIHEINDCPRVKKLMDQSLEFLQYFVLPDGSFSYELGSRESEVLFYFGITYNSYINPIANAILRKCDPKKMVTPSHVDDHYLSYRLTELCQVLNHAKKNSAVNTKQEDYQLPCERKYQLAAFCNEFACISNDHYYSVINLSKSGALVAMEKKAPYKLLIDHGVSVLDKKSRHTTSFVQQNDPRALVGKEQVQVSADFKSVKNPLFTPSKFILFRGAGIFFDRLPALTSMFKRMIRALLMVGFKKSETRLTRVITLSERFVQVDNRLEALPWGIKTLYFAGPLPSRFVPQSKYFRPYHLELPLQQKKVKDRNHNLSHTWKC